jgi:hypothetical protein
MTHEWRGVSFHTSAFSSRFLLVAASPRLPLTFLKEARDDAGVEQTNREKARALFSRENKLYTGRQNVKVKLIE